MKLSFDIPSTDLLLDKCKLPYELNINNLVCLEFHIDADYDDKRWQGLIKLGFKVDLDHFNSDDYRLQTTDEQLSKNNLTCYEISLLTKGYDNLHIPNCKLASIDYGGSFARFNYESLVKLPSNIPVVSNQLCVQIINAILSK